MVTTAVSDLATRVDKGNTRHTSFFNSTAFGLVLSVPLAAVSSGLFISFNGSFSLDEKEQEEKTVN